MAKKHKEVVSQETQDEATTMAKKTQSTKKHTNSSVQFSSVLVDSPVGIEVLP